MFPKEKNKFKGKVYPLYLAILICLIVMSGCATNQEITQPAAAATAADPIVIRKNIDDLTSAELEAYKHALRLVMDRSQGNIYDVDGYLWQAWVHNCAKIKLPDNANAELSQQTWADKLNCKLSGFDNEGNPIDSVWDAVYQQQKKQVKGIMTEEQELLAKWGHPGQCQHHSDIFLQWHRAQFYYFEQLLRLSDPEGNIKDSAGIAVSTANVSVPYWNFTEPPTGNRYPKAFEDIQSILYVNGRNTEKITADNMPKYTHKNLIAKYLGLDWQDFGGVEVGNPRLPAYVVGEGVFEATVHDSMHSEYVGGFMNDPSTAALDPIFYSFHSYIDFLYEVWLQQNNSNEVTSADIVLRSEQPESVPNPPNWPGFAPHIDPRARQDMGRGNIYFETASLGYKYDIDLEQFKSTLQSVKQILAATRFGDTPNSPLTALMEGLPHSATKTPLGVLQALVGLPSEVKETYFAAVARTLSNGDYSYRQNIYLHPEAKSEELKENLLKGASTAIAKKYLVSDRTYWQLNPRAKHTDNHSHTDIEKIILNAKITDAIADLVKQDLQDKKWVMTVAIYTDDNEADIANFSTPELLSQ